MPGSDKQVPVLDSDHLGGVTGASPALIRELLSMLSEEIPGRIRQLEGAAARDDRAGLDAAIHKLAGTAAYIGAPRLALCARRARNALAGADKASLRAAIADLRACLEALQGECRRRLQASRSSTTNARA